MKQRRLTTLTFLFFILFSFSVFAGDLFELEGGGDDAGATKEPAAGVDGKAKEGDAAQQGVPQAEKKDATPETAKLAVSDVAADPQMEKQMRGLNVEKKKKIKVVQKKDFFKDGRFEMGLGVGVINGDWDNVYVGGLNVAYHINEYFAVQGKFLYGFATTERDSRVQVEDANELNSHVSSSTMKMAGGASVVFSPLYGKLSVFGNWIPKYDVNVNLGGYFYQVSLDNGTQKENGNNFAVDAGFAGRIFLTNNFTLSLNLDWFMMQDKRLKLEGTGKKAYLKTDMLFTVNFGMFLPFDK